MGYTVGKYIQSIATIIIFTTFVNLIVPDGGFKKYIKMVLGLIIIITILSPINALVFKNKPNYDDILKRYEMDIENKTMQVQSGAYLAMQKDMILDAYKEKLIPQMTEIIEKGSLAKVDYLEVTLDENIDSKTFGLIKAIDIIVSEQKAESNKKRIIIPKIKVGTKTNQNYSTVTNEGQIEKTIKTCLIDFYNLSDVNINITVQKNS